MTKPAHSIQNMSNQLPGVKTTKFMFSIARLWRVLNADSDTCTEDFIEEFTTTTRSELHYMRGSAHPCYWSCSNLALHLCRGEDVDVELNTPTIGQVEGLINIV